MRECYLLARTAKNALRFCHEWARARREAVRPALASPAPCRSCEPSFARGFPRTARRAAPPWARNSVHRRRCSLPSNGGAVTTALSNGPSHMGGPPSRSFDTPWPTPVEERGPSALAATSAAALPYMNESVSASRSHGAGGPLPQNRQRRALPSHVQRPPGVRVPAGVPLRRLRVCEDEDEVDEVDRPNLAAAAREAGWWRGGWSTHARGGSVLALHRVRALTPARW